MKSSTSNAEKRNFFFACCVTLLIYFFDLSTSYGFNEAYLYLIPILFTIWISGRSVTGILCIASIVLTFLGLYYSRAGIPFEIALINRLYVVLGICVTWYVITKNKNNEKIMKQQNAELLQSASHLKLATESANVGVWSLHLKTQVLQWSDLHKKLWGYGLERTDLTYEDWHRLIVPEDKELAFKHVEAAKVNHTLYEVEYRIKSADDNSIRYILSAGKYYYNDKGEAETLTGISIDITEAKKAELEIIEARELFELTLHNLPSAVYHLNSKGEILYLNQLGAEQMGYDSIEEVLKEKDVYQFRKKIEERFDIRNERGDPLGAEESCSSITLNTGKPAQVVIQLIDKIKDNSFWLLTKSVPLLDANGNLTNVFTACTDITLQKEAELAKEKLAMHFKLATDSAQVGVWSLDVPNQELEWSALHKRMWGYDENRDDLTYEDWHTIILETDKALALERVENARINHTLYEVEYRIKRPTDSVIRWMKSFGQYYYNDSGEAMTLTGISIDITEQKSFTEELEKKVTERTAELAIRGKELEALNQTLDLNVVALENANSDLKSFSYVASHDLQEPLRMIKMFSQKIMQVENFTDKTQTYFNFIIDASERMQNLIISLIDFSRADKTELNFVPCDLNTIVEEAKHDLQLRIAERNAVVENDILPKILGMHIQLSQLFTNLISNAIKYCRPEVIPHVKITSERLHGTEINHLAVNIALDYYVIKIADNGIGFEPEYATKIFEAFKRLHGRSEYSGTGIGLSIVKKIVVNHNGFIVAESKLGIGSIFTIYLPV